MRLATVRLVATVALVSTPFLVGATDPRGDTGPCAAVAGSRRADPAIDVVAATAQATEGGSSVRFTIRFARRLRVPDREGKPLRVDVLVRDPSVPTVSFAYYRDLNRIVRFDAVRGGPSLLLLLLPERGTNTSLGVSVAGRTLVMDLPGRLLTRDVDLEGPGLERLTWSVIARDERTCDLLGDGRPTLEIAEAPVIAPPKEDLRPPQGLFSGRVLAALIGGAIAGLAIYVVLVRRRVRPR